MWCPLANSLFVQVVQMVLTGENQRLEGLNGDEDCRGRRDGIPLFRWTISPWILLNCNKWLHCVINLHLSHIPHRSLLGGRWIESNSREEERWKRRENGWLTETLNSVFSLGRFPFSLSLSLNWNRLRLSKCTWLLSTIVINRPQICWFQTRRKFRCVQRKPIPSEIADLSYGNSMQLPNKHAEMMKAILVQQVDWDLTGISAEAGDERDRAISVMISWLRW